MHYNKFLFNILILFTAASMHLTLYAMVIPQIEVVREATECSICQDNCEKGSSATFLRCSERANGAHIFHTRCVNQWLKSSHTCPICRKEVNTPIEITNQLTRSVDYARDNELQMVQERVITHLNLNQEEILQLNLEELRALIGENQIDLLPDASNRAHGEANRELDDQAMSSAKQKPAIGLGLAVGMLGGALFNKLGQTKSALIAKGALIGIPIAAFLYSLYNNTQRTKSTTAGYALGFLASMFVAAISNKLQNKQNEKNALEYTEPLEQDTDAE